MSDSIADRPYDLVIWGATGFTGRLTAAYLTEQYSPETLDLALGGRNRDRLETLEADITADRESWEEIPLVVGDALEADGLRTIASDTRVVCTTVGPYTAYGTPLVEACIESGTHYCDLTGEINWVREMIDRYHDAAVEAESRIVHSCGFDSIPADIGTLAVQAHAAEEFGTHCDVVRLYLEDGSGGVSGGTLASAGAMFDAVKRNPVAGQTLRNPYSLAPAGERDGIDPGAQQWPNKDSLRSAWTAPSVMAVVNERVIRRSNALLGYPWGREFRCREVIPTGEGLGGALTAGLVSAGLGLGTAAMAVEPLRRGLERFVFPDPGEGPSAEQREQGQFTLRLLGRGTTTDGPFVVDGVVSSDLDPGYGATSRMLGEAAMCLVTDDIESPLSGGILTPASGIGDPLVERLKSAGLTVDVGTRTDA